VSGKIFRSERAKFNDREILRNEELGNLQYSPRMNIVSVGEMGNTYRNAVKEL
jgi:hypothetical protein